MKCAFKQTFIFLQQWMVVIDAKEGNGCENGCPK